MKLEDWSITAHKDPFRAPELTIQRLSGKIYGHPNYEDGDEITTSPISDSNGDKIVTESGSEYELGEVNQVYEALFPNARARLFANFKKEENQEQ